MDNDSAVRLRPPRNRVARRAVTWWTTQVLVVAVPLAAALTVAGALPIPGRPWFWLGAAVVAAGGLVLAVAMPLWRYRVHRWEVTDDAVYTATGWLWQEWRVAPMSRVQTVDTARGPLQLLLGLASVTVTTASAAGPIEIAGLEHARATALAEELTATTQQTPGDAT